MAENNRDWPDVIEKFPRWITGFIVFVTAVVGFIKLWQGDTGLVTVVLLVVGIGGGLLSCLYLAFKRTPPLVEGSSKGVWRYPRARVWALTGLVLIPILVGGVVCYHLFEEAQPPTKIILLIADFDGPDPKNYRVTETVLARLSTELELYEDVQVVALGWCITEAEGSAAARAEGEKRKAAVVIWGWYGVTAEAVSISVHFDVLRSPKYMPELGLGTKGLAQTMAVAELESFTLQTRLSAEMSCLSLFTVGMACYAAADWDGAIARFTDALRQTEQSVSALDQNIIYYYRGNAYDSKGDYAQAIADYNQAIHLQPDDVEAYNNRGNAYGSKGDYAQAIADYNQAIHLQPDYVEAYNNRGIAYGSKGDYAQAIADYNQAIHLQPDLAVAYYNRGNAYNSKGDYAQAIADYNQAIHLQPDLAEAYYNRGNAYYLKGDYAQAIADFEKFLKLSNDPDWRKQAEQQLQELSEE